MPIFDDTFLEIDIAKPNNPTLMARESHLFFLVFSQFLFNDKSQSLLSNSRYSKTRNYLYTNTRARIQSSPAAVGVGSLTNCKLIFGIYYKLQSFDEISNLTLVERHLNI